MLDTFNGSHANLYMASSTKAIYPFVSFPISTSSIYLSSIMLIIVIRPSISFAQRS
jgi:hypothetical protein